jgi:RimJ/RimL family protein N-acetyltransferase
VKRAQMHDTREVRLRDGSRALVRPIRPEDRERLRDGLARLSPRTRYLRFHSPVRRLSEEQLTYLTDIDYESHMAWVALDPEDLEEPGMGVARYVRLKDDPGVAEAAITVADRYQGRGLGTILLELLTRSAMENGIHTLRNYVLADNEAMLEILEQFGATERVDVGSGVYQVDVPLKVSEEQPWRAPLRLLHEVAKGRLPPLCWSAREDWRQALEQLWSGELPDAKDEDESSHEV